jgi:hypothetical protein
MEVNCNGQGIGTTRLSGTVYAPNGSLPIYNVNVYVPNSDPGPLQQGVSCDRCADQLPGSPVVKTTTDELGHFQLDNVPVAPNLPVVVTIGKWRKQFTVSTVNMCADNAVPAANTTLPKNHTEGDMPQIAISTGGCDALECLARKLGVDDAEFTPGTGTGKIHLYAGVGGTSAIGTSTLGDSQTWWSKESNLDKYDIVMFACECDQETGEKPPAALQALSDYANKGGRVFLSHWQNYWIEAGPQPWPSIANFDNNQDVPTSATDSINTTFPRGMSMYTWLGGPEVKALDANHKLDVNDPRDTAKSINNYPGSTTPRADDFVDLGGCQGGCSLSTAVQDFQFTVPNMTAQDTNRCGKVVFSDMHVSGNTTAEAFPAECSGATFTPQEKALAFIFFDIASCVGPVVN